jgi:plasmid stabilization system protein ParE
MMPRYRLLPAAWADLEQQLQYIGERNPDAARRIRDALRHAFEQIAAHPWGTRRIPMTHVVC